MPKSKRSTVVSLTKTKKRFHEPKEKLIEEIHECVDKYGYIWIFSVKDMRNTFLKEVRADFKSSRFFCGKKRVMAKALGSTPEEEYKQGVSQISKDLHGEVGLFFTNEPSDKVYAYFKDFRRPDYARSGVVANQEVVIQAGPLQQGEDPMPHNMEPRLRSLGMPTVLDNGIVTLPVPYTICNEGDILSTNQALLLKIFYYQLSEFSVNLLAYYHDGTVTPVNQS